MPPDCWWRRVQVREAVVMSLITATGLSKRFGDTKALTDVSLKVEPGRIIGLLGRNGAGKTTLLRSIMGLGSFDGYLEVFDQNPLTNRLRLMNKLAFIADVATLPRWITINQAIKLMKVIHPRFDETKARGFLKQTKIDCDKKVKTFSKGMIVQAHLALIIAIDSELMILDEPTLGLDIVYRKKFYSNLLQDYFNENRSVIISTHQVEEIEDILTHIIMIDDGEIIMDISMEEFHSTYSEVTIAEQHAGLIRQYNHLHEIKSRNMRTFIFEDRTQITDSLQTTENLPDGVRVEDANLSDVFVAKLEKRI
jgi:ABC-2 type transport system ATP-binding protein